MPRMQKQVRFIPFSMYVQIFHQMFFKHEKKDFGLVQLKQKDKSDGNAQPTARNHDAF